MNEARPAGRGDPLAEAVDDVRREIENIHAGAGMLEEAIPRYEAARARLDEDFGVKMALDPTPIERAAIMEWGRRAEPDVESILPTSLKAIA